MTDGEIIARVERRRKWTAEEKVALLAEVGATLEKGAPILTLEVMKMEQTLRAPFAGVLKAIKCKVGDIVQEGVELAEIEPAA